jgi:carboxypeptidase C (cathepsin A)
MFCTAALAALVVCTSSLAAPDKSEDPHEAASDPALMHAQTSTSSGSVTVAGTRIDYTAQAGTLVVDGTGDEADEPQVSMFYVAYFKKGEDAAKRPVTFLYNGGPGSASLWLHMGAFGPRRVVTADHSHTPAAPYAVVNNDYSLLDASDLVFIDAPGTGFSRLIADDKDPAKRAQQMDKRKKAIYSVDGDARMFDRFITGFLSKYARWNSPKYLFGESYGTTRSAVLANELQNDGVDLNGVILLSAILNFDDSIDGPQFNPGVDLPYELALPTYAATAYYHHKLPQQPPALEPFLREVEAYAMGDYTLALQAGSHLDATRKNAVAEQLHRYTGLPVAYLLKAGLRVNGHMFAHELLAGDGLTVGRLDTRFSGPSFDPMAREEIDNDPLATAIGAAYVAAFNDYVRQQLKFGEGMRYLSSGEHIYDLWDHDHKAAGVDGDKMSTSLNVMPDLALAMKTDPNLRVYVNGGYYDLATAYFAADFDTHHLPIPASLDHNISYSWYPSGHMVYAHEPSMKALHDNVAAFIAQDRRG